MNLTFRTWVVFLLLTLIMGLNNVYSSLLTGWGEGGSIVAVILCLIFLPKVDRTIINYNLGQTIASAGGSVGFTVAILASIYYLHSSQGSLWQPPLLPLSIFIAALSVMAVTLAVPFRPIVVKWFFPGAIACATILRAVSSDDLKERNHARNVMGASGLVSVLFTLPTKIALTNGGVALWSHFTLMPGFRFSLDPLLYGIGIIIGHRIGISMLAGALFKHYCIDTFLHGDEKLIADYSRWIAVGLMTLPAFSSALFALFLKNVRTLPGGFFPKKSLSEDRLTTKQRLMIGIIFAIALLLASIQIDNLFGVAWWHFVFCTAIAAPMCFALGKVASETGINPVRLLAITLLFIFSLFGRQSPLALLAIGVSGATFAAVAVDLFIDLRTGYLVRANPKQQIFLQYLGVIPSSFATVFFLHLLAENFGFGEGKYFPAPGAVVWAMMADAFSLGIDAIPTGIWSATAWATFVGVIMSFLENWNWTKRFAPSSFAVGIALLLPFEMSAAICLGSIFAFIMVRMAKTNGVEAELQIRNDLFKAGSAIFAASSIAGIIAVLLISLGIFYIPTD